MVEKEKRKRYKRKLKELRKEQNSKRIKSSENTT